ncbi:MAG: IMPACT family protein [bacterium]
MADYFTIAQLCETDLRVKDSLFVAWIAPAASRAQAEELITQRSRACADATHNCFALRTGMGEQLAVRSSDANEPAGTAGRPMLQALEARRLTNVAAVVTRYFGGTKLGTGGLIRAYSKVMFDLLDRARLIPFFETCRLCLVYQYPDSPAVERAMRKFEVLSIEEIFGAEIRRLVEVRKDHQADFESALLDLSAGRVEIEINSFKST